MRAARKTAERERRERRGDAGRKVGEVGGAESRWVLRR
jgi:hypothetical protein